MNCIFCSREELNVVFENELAFAIYDKYPVTKGHMLIIPKNHVDTYFDASREVRESLFSLVDQCKEHLDDLYKPDGYNIGMNCGRAAGQTVMHLHIHVIPRKTGDIDDPTGGVRGAIPSMRKY